MTPIFHTPIPSIVRARAHHLAKRAVERELAAQGRRVPYAEIIALRRAYQAEHQQELLAQAMADLHQNPSVSQSDHTIVGVDRSE